MCQTIHQINQLKLGQKIGLKKIMMDVERITPRVKLNFKRRCQSQVNVITVMYIELYQSHHKQETTQDNVSKEVVFESCAQFADYMNEYSNNYSKTSGGLWQNYRDESALNNAGAVDNFPSNSTLFKFKQKNPPKIPPKNRFNRKWWY